MSDTGKARVFISCGQSDKTDEREIADRIANEFRNAGFDPYVAVREQCLLGLRENIFAQLSSSEYFLFVDFKRERLETGDGEHRGSLFSHQELAIASYLQMPVVAFREEGVKELDGMIGILQLNAIPFSDRSKLHEDVASAIQQKNWKSNWRNLLSLEATPSPSPPLRHRGRNNKTARWYHIDVENRHHERTARNCAAYLKSYRQLPSGEKSPFPTAELKWGGVTFPYVSMGPKSCRRLGAFYVLVDEPGAVYLDVLSDSDEYRDKYKIDGPGDFELEYEVLSDNFPPASTLAKLTLGTKLSELQFAPQSNPEAQGVAVPRPG